MNDTAPVLETILEAQDRLDALYCDILSIEAQLSDSGRIGVDGKRMSAKVYRSWRTKALRALASKRSDYRLLNRWIARENGTVLGQALALLRSCREVLGPPDGDADDLILAIDKLLGEVQV